MTEYRDSRAKPDPDLERLAREGRAARSQAMDAAADDAQAAGDRHLREAIARKILGLVVQTCARTLNHRPRYDRGGRSRVELYNEPVTAEQIDKARAALEERRRKQELARATLAARQDKSEPARLIAAVARRIHATHRVAYRERQEAVLVINAHVVPLS